MTINSTNIVSGPYTGNGVTSQFSYTFRVDDKTELEIYETTDAGVETLLVVDTDYTVNDIGTDGGGTIDRIAGALPASYTWYIRSNRTATQLTDFGNQGAFFSEVHESAFDKLTYLVLQLIDKVARSMRVSDSYSGSVSLELPNPVAGRSFKWNATADAIENTANDLDTIASDLTGAVTDAETAQAAAEAAQAAAEAVFDNFDDTYLGAKASTPTLDNDGDALQDGAMYFDTTSNLLNVYDLGTTTWIAIPVTALGSLTDVTLTSIAANEILLWNGSAWINRTLDELGVALVNGDSTEEFAVAADAYDSGWNGNTGAARKDDVYDEIESVKASIPAINLVAAAHVTGAATPVILKDMNIASVTRSATGTYDFVFDTPMDDANYIVIAHVPYVSGGFNTYEVHANRTVNGFTIRTITSSSANADYIDVSVFA